MLLSLTARYTATDMVKYTKLGLLTRILNISNHIYFERDIFAVTQSSHMGRQHSCPCNSIKSTLSYLGDIFFALVIPTTLNKSGKFGGAFEAIRTIYWWLVLVVSMNRSYEYEWLFHAWHLFLHPYPRLMNKISHSSNKYNQSKEK